MRNVRRGTTRISYRVCGAGPQTVVFLHGLAGHAGEWTRTARALQPEFTTIALDQRGHGTSTREPSDTSRAAFVNDVVAVLEDAACPLPVTMVGQSMGAHTALLVAAQRPDLVGALIMVEGDLGGGGATAARELHQALATWPKRFDSYEALLDFFGGDTEHGRVWAQSYEHRSDGWCARFDQWVMETVMTPIFDNEWWQAWSSLRAATLLVLAERSNIDTGRVDRMCQRRPDTQRAIVTEAGHDLHLEQPDAWITTLQHYLSTTPIPTDH